MSSISDQVYNKFKSVAKTVKDDFKRKGIVLPSKTPNGNIILDGHVIVKQPNGFYVIKNKSGEIVIDGINLPQSAALLANSLALGKWIDVTIYNLDREYGYKTFESELYKRNAARSLKSNNLDRADMLFTKFKLANDRVESTKRQILSSFEKLRRLH